ncbi:hypothetical protein [Frankia sp. Cr1]|uniref:hypothetical protein n=1 Tax=Frankia sp. Cr1 TaxID=3073931 RepID=UPI002AD41346|nr:hypothetical protein [Frankia sp. Cr1]
MLRGAQPVRIHLPASVPPAVGASLVYGWHLYVPDGARPRPLVGLLQTVSLLYAGAVHPLAAQLVPRL